MSPSGIVEVALGQESKKRRTWVGRFSVHKAVSPICAGWQVQTSPA